MTLATAMHFPTPAPAPAAPTAASHCHALREQCPSAITKPIAPTSPPSIAASTCTPRARDPSTASTASTASSLGAAERMLSSRRARGPDSRFTARRARSTRPDAESAESSHRITAATNSSNDDDDTNDNNMSDTDDDDRIDRIIRTPHATPRAMPRSFLPRPRARPRAAMRDAAAPRGPTPTQIRVTFARPVADGRVRQVFRLLLRTERELRTYRDGYRVTRVSARDYVFAAYFRASYWRVFATLRRRLRHEV